ncbi:hypothetical protein CIPAW_16G021400 [Carya illinoinensis]|uniref:Uncharacterized protein n=1 Tax=Carya illinoinensis TaxID=32201 RepID=A0A8T1N3R7_CARIL|nr:hypothetical protein CIPAW_16G021400 [Carya illinoinensis]
MDCTLGPLKLIPLTRPTIIMKKHDHKILRKLFNCFIDIISLVKTNSECNQVFWLFLQILHLGPQIYDFLQYGNCQSRFWRSFLDSICQAILILEIRISLSLFVINA